MTDAATVPFHDARSAPPAQAQDVPAWQRAVIERQLWVVGRLAEGGLQIALAIERQAVEGQPAPDQAAPGHADPGEFAGPGPDEVEDDGEAAEPAPRGDLSLAYARVSRAVRLALLLQSKLIEDLRRLDSDAAREVRHAEIDRNVERPRLVAQRKIHLQRIIARIARPEHEDFDEIRRLMKDAAERVEQVELYGDLLTRPFSEIIAQLCRDMGLHPHWPRLAEEAWARDEMRSGAVGAPLAGVMGKAQPVRSNPLRSSRSEPEPDALARRRASG